MSGEASNSHSGGVNISGSVGIVGGDIVGRDKTTIKRSTAELNDIFRPLDEAIESSAPERRDEAEAKLFALKQEAAKGEQADDGVIAKLADGFVGLVPEAAGAVVSAFASPILGAVAGPVTNYVMGKFRGE